MHGATLLDASDAVLRPAILWNDGRSAAQCAALERAVPASRAITGNLAMPGFTAPKLLWVRDHEPAVFARVRRVLLPKDWLRLRMSGDAATDCSDASGTLWLDVAKRAWSPEMLGACGLGEAAMPRVFEGSEATGRLRAEIADAWGAPRVPIAAGGGDQAAGAAGAGVVRAGEASLALGTSGVLFVAGERFQPNPARAVHAFCHCLPGRWHQMSVLLSAASCLAWVTRLTGAADEAALLAEVEAQDRPAAGALLFLPYLSGERTPHNDPAARGVFFGLSHDTDRATLARAVLEGVAFAFADAQQALLEAGAAPREITVLGGGARSELWVRILAAVLDAPLSLRAGADVGPALGAARLARLAVSGERAEDVCTPPPLLRVVEPDPALRDHYRAPLESFRALYARLRDAFAAAAPGEPR
jgi:xylulokinase